MHKLGRSVRFSINPFLSADSAGFNAYASKPAGEGLALYFELWVELTGPVDPSTGFIVNVTEIDDAVRRHAVPVFASWLREAFRAARHMRLDEVTVLLNAVWHALHARFGHAKLNRLALKLSPYRELTMESVDSKEVLFSERFEFAATHKLWNDEFTERKNFDVFGKCANPDGHGHNYVIEVTVKIEADDDFTIADFEKVVNNKLIEIVDHRNLNTEIAEFEQTIPTVENIATFAWKRLLDKFDVGRLHKVTVWETDKTYCTYSG